MVIQRYRNPARGHVPYRIKVRGGKNVYLSPERENKGLELSDGYERVSTVDDMFSMITESCKTFDTVKVEYDAEFGYPTSIAMHNSTGSVDDADLYKVVSFNAIDSSMKPE